MRCSNSLPKTGKKIYIMIYIWMQKFKKRYFDNHRMKGIFANPIDTDDLAYAAIKVKKIRAIDQEAIRSMCRAYSTTGLPDSISAGVAETGHRRRFPALAAQPRKAPEALSQSRSSSRRRRLVAGPSHVVYRFRHVQASPTCWIVFSENP